jgi:hypothetical protein
MAGRIGKKALVCQDDLPRFQDNGFSKNKSLQAVESLLAMLINPLA